MRRRLGVSRQRKGFSLVELIIALMMLTFGLLALASALASSILAQRVSSSRSELTVMAEAKLEQLRGIGSTVAADPLRAQLAVGGSLSSNTFGYADSVQAANARWYLRRWQISDGIAGTREVNIRVSQMIRYRRELRSERFTTLIALR